MLVGAEQEEHEDGAHHEEHEDGDHLEGQGGGLHDDDHHGDDDRDQERKEQQVGEMAQHSRGHVDDEEEHHDHGPVNHPDGDDEEACGYGRGSPWSLLVGDPRSTQT